MGPLKVESCTTHCGILIPCFLLHKERGAVSENLHLFISRFDKLKEQLQAWLNQEVDRVQRLQAELKQSQDLLDSVELGVNNFYFRMSCVALEVCTKNCLL